MTKLRHRLRNRLGNEEGVALIMAIIILFIVLAMGTALIMTATSQKQNANREQNSESAFWMAEGALDAQIYALSVQWPTAGDAPSPSTPGTLGYPTSCNASTAGTSYCPSTGDLSAYPSNTQACPAGTPGDAWNPGGNRSAWTTYVRDAGPQGSSQQQLFNDATEESAAPYNSSYANVPSTNDLWIRAVGQVNCKTAVVIAQVSMQSLGLSFPKLVLNANGFNVTNNGQKTIINTLGTGTSPSQISVRCGGVSYSPPPPSTCASFGSSQISPSNPNAASSWVNPPSPTPILSASQLQEAKLMAQADGTYYGPGTNCNSLGASQIQGQVVFVDAGPTCAISIQSNPVINSSSSPGWLIINDGTINFVGSATFYGVIYGVNQSNNPGSIVTLGGTSTVVGGLAVNGNATLSLGSSGNGVDCTPSNKCGDLMFDPNAFNSILGFGGADETPNTFRQLPASQ
jgi:type II secretory pathway pseudopilin PulG